MAHICFSLNNLNVLLHFLLALQITVKVKWTSLFPLLVTYSFYLGYRKDFFPSNPNNFTKIFLCWSFWVSLSRGIEYFFSMWFQTFFLSLRKIIELYLLTFILFPCLLWCSFLGSSYYTCVRFSCLFFMVVTFSLILFVSLFISFFILKMSSFFS